MGELPDDNVFYQTVMSTDRINSTDAMSTESLTNDIFPLSVETTQSLQPPKWAVIFNFTQLGFTVIGFAANVFNTCDTVFEANWI